MFLQRVASQLRKSGWEAARSYYSEEEKRK